MYTAITGEGKAEQFKKVFESGMMSKSMITLTCLYVQNKDNFMVKLKSNLQISKIYNFVSY